MSRGARAQPKGMTMESTTRNPSKRVRIVLCTAFVLVVAAVAPASGFAASWTSAVTPDASWTS